jgi:hypothetical protein
MYINHLPPGSQVATTRPQILNVEDLRFLLLEIYFGFLTNLRVTTRAARLYIVYADSYLIRVGDPRIEEYHC